MGLKKYENRIIVDPEIRHGKPIIKKYKSTEGMKIEEVAKEYGIEKEDVLAVIESAMIVSCILKLNFYSVQTCHAQVLKCKKYGF